MLYAFIFLHLNYLLLKDYLSLVVRELIGLVSYFLPQLMVVFVQMNSNSCLCVRAHPCVRIDMCSSDVNLS